MLKSLTEYIENNKSRYISELTEFIGFPSISTDPAYRGEVIECAGYLKSHLETIGMRNVELIDTGGHPLVYADWLDAGKDKPTLLIYGHYDVQPVDPVELWTSPPFKAEIRGDNIYARGAADDKGQVFIHLKAIEAYLKNLKSLPVNIKIIIEGEEEIGSPNLEPFIKNNRSKLMSDVCVVSDTAMFSKDIPALGYSLRGLCYMQIDVKGPDRDLHSGQFGGAVNNPINALASIIAKMKDDNGKILIDGFYDDVLPLTQAEAENFSRLPLDDDVYARELGVTQLYGEPGYSTLERIWSRPSLDCNGIWGGFTGEGAKTVLPSRASAKISIRIVPDQKPHKIAELFTSFVHKVKPAGVDVRIYEMHHSKPWISSIDSKWNQAAARALCQGFGREPVFIREGGSIPIVNTIDDELGIPVVLLGFGLPDENAHSPDEHLNLNNFFNGIKTSVFFYSELIN